MNWADELCLRRANWHQEKAMYDAGHGPDPGQKPGALHSRYAHTQVKAALEAMFGTKCAYCEGEIHATGYAHVEHYRPQSIYPLLAYDWHNLLQGCGRCNGIGGKGDKFPVLPHGRTLTEHKQHPNSRTDNDDPILIDPCREDPALSLTFRGARVVALNNRGKRSREIYGLQREALLDDRRRVLRGVHLALKSFLTARHRKDFVEARRYRVALKEMVDSSQPYAGMVRVAITNQGIDWTRL